jgi:hypothetical protein
MIHYDIKRMRQAVQLLVDTPYFRHHLVKLRSTVLKPRALPFKDKLEVLNELLIVGRQSVEAMENLIQVAEFKRTDRNDYQRVFMANKRKRERKLISLIQARTGQTLSLDERLAALHAYSEAWRLEKEQFLQSLGAMTWEDKNLHTVSFWQLIDAEIDAAISDSSAAFRDHIWQLSRPVLKGGAARTRASAGSTPSARPKPQRKH